ncbi:MAG: glycosyltransferase, partial [Campylobacterales bacterium]
LVDAIAQLSQDIRNNVKCVIVGKGEERENLDKQIAKLGLKKHVHIEEWMEIEDFKALIACSDVFVHPARFDAYGGGTLNAMGVGTPVIGTNEAGSAPDRVIDEENGFLYDASDTQKLSNLIKYALTNRKRLQGLGRCARKTAERWDPIVGKNIIKKEAI